MVAHTTSRPRAEHSYGRGKDGPGNGISALSEFSRSTDFRGGTDNDPDPAGRDSTGTRRTAPGGARTLMDSRNFTYMFYGFAVAWVAVIVYVFTLVARERRLSEEMKRLRQM